MVGVPGRTRAVVEFDELLVNYSQVQVTFQKQNQVVEDVDLARIRLVMEYGEE